jgi:hypothetical protein
VFRFFAFFITTDGLEYIAVGKRKTAAVLIPELVSADWPFFSFLSACSLFGGDAAGVVAILDAMANDSDEPPWRRRYS